MSKRGAKGEKKISYAMIIIIAIAIALITLSLFRTPTGQATTSPVNMSASITSTVTCTATNLTMGFGELTPLGSDRTTLNGTVIDASGSNVNTKITASVTTSSSWIPGFTSENNAWGILCANSADSQASGLDDTSGAYRTQKHSPSANTCRNAVGATGAMLCLGSPACALGPSMVAQKTTTNRILSKIKVPQGTASGSYWTIVTFSCSELTGGQAGLQFELADIERPTANGQIKCDGSTANVFVASAGLGAAPQTVDKGTLSKIFVCIPNGTCVPATVTQYISQPTCPNVVAPITATPNAAAAEVVCGTFTCPAGIGTSGSAQVLIESMLGGPLAGTVVHSYYDATLAA
ncbi:MAG: hypothetical protein QXD77_03340 [Candidatus Aenigmatarchaeota archaeon]